MQVQAVVAGGGGGTIQCRIYDGAELIAIQNGVGHAVCTLTPTTS